MSWIPKVSENQILQTVKECEKNEQLYLLRRRKRRAKRYGLNLQQLEQIEAIKRCQLCGIPDTETKCLHLDHSHETGIVRGILCTGCNLSIGYLERLMREKLLDKAFEWVQKGEI